MWVLSPVPRGSQLTTSKRPSPRRFSRGPMRLTVATPATPGPPKFTNSEPIRCAGLLAGRRITDSEIVRPSGCDQFSGTATRAHCSPPPAPCRASTRLAPLRPRRRRPTPPPPQRPDLGRLDAPRAPAQRVGTRRRPYGPTSRNATNLLIAPAITSCRMPLTRLPEPGQLACPRRGGGRNWRRPLSGRPGRDPQPGD